VTVYRHDGTRFLSSAEVPHTAAVIRIGPNRRQAVGWQPLLGGGRAAVLVSGRGEDESCPPVRVAAPPSR
jgi:hypothetical protein